MSTIWDHAVRALQTVHPDLDSHGRPLAYYCGGPDPRCHHHACRMVSALAEADLLGYSDTVVDAVIHEESCRGGACSCGGGQAVGTRTGVGHYREAGMLADSAARHTTELPADMRIAEVVAARAQVHATLALAAATALPTIARYMGDSDEITEWAEATGARPSS